MGPKVQAGPLHLETPSLHRNQACKTCRSRKIRCDAAKPVCTPCAKARRKKHGIPIEIRCVYPPPRIGGAAAKSADSESADDAIDPVTQEPDLPSTSTAPSSQNIPHSDPSTPLAQLGVSYDRLPVLSGPSDWPNLSSQPRQTYPPDIWQSDRLPFSTIFSSFPANSGENIPDVIDIPWNKEDADLWQDIEGEGEEDLKKKIQKLRLKLKQVELENEGLKNQQAFKKAAVAQETSPPSGSDGSNFNLDFPDALYQVFTPGWPPGLPDSVIVREYAQSFHQSFPLVSYIIPQGRLEFSLTLRPDHPGFPHEGLIHAICALGAVRLPDRRIEEIGGIAGRYWGEFGHPSDYHFAKAKNLSNFAGATMPINNRPPNMHGKYFQQLQSVVLLVLFGYIRAYGLEGWQLAGFAVRLCIVLGLNTTCVPLLENGQRSLSQGGRTLIAEPKDSAELFERSITFWLAAMHEWFAGVTTGWAVSLRLDDISSYLPIPADAPIKEDPEGVRRALDPHHPDFLTYHPSYVGTFQLQLKASVLVAKVLDFTQHGSWTGDPVEIRNSEPFQRLDDEIISFRYSLSQIPLSRTDPTRRATGCHIAHALSHVCCIILHHPYCTFDTDDPSVNRCLQSARQILSSVLAMQSSGAFFNPFGCFAVTRAGRVLIRDFAIKKVLGDHVGANALESEVRLLIQQLESTSDKILLARASATVLANLLENPSVLIEGLSPPATGFSKHRQKHEVIHNVRATFDNPHKVPINRVGGDVIVEKFTPASGLDSSSSGTLHSVDSTPSISIGPSLQPLPIPPHLDQLRSHPLDMPISDDSMKARDPSMVQFPPMPLSTEQDLLALLRGAPLV